MFLIMKITTHKYTMSKVNTELVDEGLFEAACQKFVHRVQGANGIGTLSEKTVHAVLKYYYCPDEAHHEVKIGDYVADACIDGEIYEIQSKAFHLLRGKLTEFLKEYDVTVIYPVAITKFLRYVDPDTGEITSPKKSSKKGSIYDVVPELYGIKGFLNNPRLHIVICFIEMEEYKLLDGYGKDRKHHATKTDRIPTKIIGEFRIEEVDDYLKLLPEGLPERFTNKDISLLSGYHVSYCQMLTNVLSSVGLIDKVGKVGNALLYEIGHAGR